jgi:hypothetical protein
VFVERGINIERRKPFIYDRHNRYLCTYMFIYRYPYMFKLIHVCLFVQKECLEFVYIEIYVYEYKYVYVDIFIDAYIHKKGPMH